MPLDGAAAGAPLAIQVADRWHLWHNLAEAVERAVARHRSCLQEPPPDPEPAPPAAQAAPVPEARLAARTRARHADVHAALARVLSATEISRTLRLDGKTVRRYATAATADEVTGGARLTRPGLLGPHQDWLRKLWDEGVRSTERLHAELRDRGYRGSLRTLRRVTARLRQDTAVPAPSQVVVAARGAGSPGTAITLMGDTGARGLRAARQPSLGVSEGGYRVRLHRCDLRRSEAGKRLYCHPNTVRHRLHRIERQTGRLLQDPRACGELLVALEALRRLPEPAGGFAEADRIR